MGHPALPRGDTGRRPLQGAAWFSRTQELKTARRCCPWGNPGCSCARRHPWHFKHPDLGTAALCVRGTECPGGSCPCRSELSHASTPCCTSELSPPGTINYTKVTNCKPNQHLLSSHCHPRSHSHSTAIFPQIPLLIFPGLSYLAGNTDQSKRDPFPSTREPYK